MNRERERESEHTIEVTENVERKRDDDLALLPSEWLLQSHLT